MYTDLSILSLILRASRPKSERHLIDDFLSTHQITPESALHTPDMSYRSETLELYDRAHLSSQDWTETLSGQKAIIDLEMRLIRVLARMEANGVFLDVSLIESEAHDLHRQLETLKQEIFFLADEEFNILSPKQLQVILFHKLQLQSGKKTKTGYSVDAEVLEYLSPQHPIVSKILDYRSITKLLSTYLEALPRAIRSQTGRIHPTFMQIGSLTGRIACEHPNLQNIPAHGLGAETIRRAFRPMESDRSYVVADFAQMELKILANLSKDSSFIEAFLSGEDIHTRTARFLFDHDTITSDERRIAKAVNFGVIYGVSGFGLMKTTRLSRKDADAFIEAFYELYPGVRSYYEQLLEEAREHRYVETFLGRRRYIDGINDSNKMLRSAAEREAMNMPIQGAGAEVLKLSLLKLDEYISRLGSSARMILCVHDEIIFEVDDAEVDDFAHTLQELLRFTDLGPVPLTVDVGVGKSWWEAKN